jgi:hypothetical protein
LVIPFDISIGSYIKLNKFYCFYIWKKSISLKLMKQKYDKKISKYLFMKYYYNGIIFLQWKYGDYYL